VSGRIATGRATSYDVARRAGVAQSTVSRCFQEDSSISPATRRRVLKAAEQLGYTPNALARSLITQRSDLVGVIIARYTLRANPDVIHAIGESLSAAGKRVMLVTVESDYPSFDDLRGVLEYPLEGLISCVLMADADLAELRRRRVPVVFYNRDPGPATADCVTAGHYEAAAGLAATLHAAGHRRFLCVGGPRDAFVSHQRVQGFLSGLRALRVKNTPLLETDYSYEQGRTTFLRHLAASPHPQAVFCANDQIAMGVIDACRYDLHLRVPDDISVVGFDDVAEAGRPSYELTTFFQDPIRMGRQAVELLLRRLAEPGGAPIRSVVSASFVRRRSARLGQDK
jgi:DNA-binding LacI/PurR family transcriptional regulator